MKKLKKTKKKSLMGIKKRSKFEEETANSDIVKPKAIVSDQSTGRDFMSISKQHRGNHGNGEGE